ncbi:hypothetical protein IV203_018375 [Nitzschia inconspicua]|uniref:Uncharacterized protein n=1 Tax=Nitzschia inconspicua TaxID=303405 RepID=A0A9K3M1R9_9STRA|nr:hypothetical protein IV203_018375 [Nitzschia inconspicua]
MPSTGAFATRPPLLLDVVNTSVTLSVSNGVNVMFTSSTISGVGNVVDANAVFLFLDISSKSPGNKNLQHVPSRVLRRDQGRLSSASFCSMKHQQAISSKVALMCLDPDRWTMLAAELTFPVQCAPREVGV